MGNKAAAHHLTPEEKSQAIAMYVAGESQLNIGKRFGIAQTSISVLFAKEDIKEHITSAQKELTIRCLTPVLENIGWLVRNYREVQRTPDGSPKLDKYGNEIPLLNKEQSNHAWDAHKEILKAAGITPYPTDSKLVQYIYQDNRQVFMSPVMSEALKKYGDSLKLNDNVIDIKLEPVGK
ncbi:MAG: hypothetical protein A2W23_07615 [Planctomycetes bacterium RBG_16_43_13]|nr:MAG: hypothetical protein A2W23_07615 [Planctomycetes bacterium RBG_16_43_13]